MGVGSSGCKAGPAWELENLTVWSREGEPQAGTSHTHLHWTSWAPGTWRGAFSTVLAQWQLWRDPCNSGNVPDTTGSSCCAACRGDGHQVRQLGWRNTASRLLSLPHLPDPISKAEGNNQTCCLLPPSPTLHTSKPRRTTDKHKSIWRSQLRSPWLLVSLLAMGSNTAHAETICKSLSALEGAFPPRCLISVLLSQTVTSLHRVEFQQREQSSKIWLLAREESSQVHF